MWVDKPTNKDNKDGIFRMCYAPADYHVLKLRTRSAKDRSFPYPETIPNCRFRKDSDDHFLWQLNCEFQSLAHNHKRPPSYDVFADLVLSSSWMGALRLRDNLSVSLAGCICGPRRENAPCFDKSRWLSCCCAVLCYARVSSRLTAIELCSGDSDCRLFPVQSRCNCRLRTRQDQKCTAFALPSKSERKNIALQLGRILPLQQRPAEIECWPV
jgi:hypothetical protein